MGRNDLDRRHDSAARSPEVAAMLAARHDDPSARYRRLLLLVGGAALGIGLLWFVLASRWPGRQKPSEPAQEIDTSHYLSPIKTEAGAAGEEIAPFTGFAVSVETEPTGAIVTIRGVPRGEAPVLANIDCRASERIEIRAEKVGFRPARQEIQCRADTLVKLALRLAR